MGANENALAGKARRRDPAQESIIEASPDARLLVVAGPGSGKTHVAAMRLVHLLRAGLQPSQILVLSFSRSAVATLTRRIGTLGLDEVRVIEALRHLAIRTFDSWAFRLLRQSGIPPADLLGRSHDENIEAATGLLRDLPDDDLAARIGGLKHVIVDEFQDLPGVRADLVAALLARLEAVSGGEAGFTVLGDPVQSIFRFAARAQGREVTDDPWLGLKRQFGRRLTEIALDRNYRATEELAHKTSILRKILSSDGQTSDRKLAGIRKYLETLPAAPEDTKIGPAWLQALAPGSVAVLTRTNGEALQVWKMLVGPDPGAPAESVTLRLAGSSSPAPAWIAAILSSYRHPTVTRSVFDKLYARSSDAIGPDGREATGLPRVDVAWQRLLRAAGAADGESMLDLESLRSRIDWHDAFPDDQTFGDTKLLVTTVHQSKGMEFDNVALLDEAEVRAENTPEDPLEAAHVAFVALTRAGRHVGRLPSACIYRAPFKRDCRGGRTRQVLFGRMFNMQIGLPGDLDPFSFVDEAMLSGSSAEAVQKLLIEGAASLRGRKVVLSKVAETKDDVRYAVAIQEVSGKPGQVIGRTSPQVTQDLLSVFWEHCGSLPKSIFNLRIGDVITVGLSGDVSDTVPEPWRSSRLWLGVSLVGTGDFKPWRANGN